MLAAALDAGRRAVTRAPLASNDPAGRSALLLAIAASIAPEADPTGADEAGASCWIVALGYLTIDDLPGRTVASAAALHLALFHDIVPNPFDPVAIEPAWRTRDVIGLCEAMTAAGDFSAMPVLADALQDAGCDDERVLGHCRAGGPHARGCWVIDALLGFEAFPAE